MYKKSPNMRKVLIRENSYYEISPNTRKVPIRESPKKYQKIAKLPCECNFFFYIGGLRPPEPANYGPIFVC